MIKVLFEGQTRRPACVAFLRMLYTKLMNNINRDTMLPLFRSNKEVNQVMDDNDPQNPIMGNQQSQQEENKSKPKPTGLFRGIWNSISGKTKKDNAA